MKVRQKLYLSTVLLSLFVAVAVGFVLSCLRHVATEHEMSREFLEAGASLDRLRVASMGLGSGVRTDAQWLAAAESARKEISDVVTLWDDRPAMELLDSELDAAVAYFKRSGGIAGIANGSELARRTELIDVHFDQAHEIALEGQLAREKKFARLIGSLAFSLLVLTILGAAISFEAVRNFFAMVRQLTEGAAAIGSGVLDHHISLDARNEFGGLVTGFNEMAANLRKKTVSLGALQREVDERRRVEKAVEEKGRYLYLLEAVSVAANRADRAVDALAACTKLIGEHLGWPIGFVYLPCGDGAAVRIVPATTYLRDPERHAGFAATCEKFSFNPDEGLPGLVLRSRQPQWVVELPSALAREAGLVSALSFPVLVGDEVAAVYEFFSDEVAEPNAQLLEVLSHIGIQLGRAIERHRAITLKTHLETIFQGSADAVMAANAQGNITHWNPAAERVFGYSAAEVLGHPVTLIHPDGCDLDVVRKVSEGMRVVDYQAKCKTKDGRRIDVALSLAPLIFSDGTLAGFSGIARDVSEKHRADELIRENERRLKETQQLARLGSWEYDVADDTAVWSDVMYDLFERDRGLPPFRAQEFIDVVHPVDAPEVARSWQDAVANSGQLISFDARITVPSGTERWVSFKGEIEYGADGAVVRARGAMLDITERKLLEHALREREERFRILLEQLPASVWTTDLDLRIIYCAGGTASPRRRPPGSFIGHCVRDYANEPAMASSIAAHEEALAGRRVNFEMHYEDRHYTAHLEPYRNAAGAVQGILGVSLDITDRQEAEEKLRRTTTDLLRSNRELDEFAHIISHDLQEPLRMVICYLNLLVQRYGAQLDKPAGEFVDFAVDGAQRMKGLIADLLSYSRVGSRGGRFVEIDGEEPVAAAMRNLKLVIEESGARIEVGPLPHIWADSAQLAQAFQNLISNSIKFHGEQTPRVRIACDENDTEWIFSVADNGIGFAMGEHERIFQIFQRLHTRGAYPGSGVGLAICKRIVNRHGGRIWGESRAGEGSIFYFTIPKRPRVAEVDPDKKIVDFSQAIEQNRDVG